MFQQVKIPILGIVENMAGFTPPGSEEIFHIFGEGGGTSAAEEFEPRTHKHAGSDGTPPQQSLLNVRLIEIRHIENVRNGARKPRWRELRLRRFVYRRMLRPFRGERSCRACWSSHLEM